MGSSIRLSLVQPFFHSNRPCPPVSSCLLVTACSECRILRQFTPMGLRLSTLVFCRGKIVHAASLVILTQTDKHWGALACPRGAALFSRSMTQGTLLRVSAIRHVGNAAMEAEDGIWWVNGQLPRSGGWCKRLPSLALGIIERICR